MSAVEAGLATVAPDAADCPLCASRRSSPDSLAADRRDDIIPWAAVLASSIVLASVAVGAARWFGFGAATGLLAGAACAWLTVRSALARRSLAHARQMADLAADGDSRVETVIRQFEWAVNDVVKLKRDVERADAAADALVARATQRERYVQQLERELFEARERLVTLVVKEQVGEVMSATVVEPAPEVVPFRWALHNDGYRANLELECGISAHRPKRVRIVDDSGGVVMVSGTPMRHEDGSVGFTLADPPAALVADIDAGRDCAFHLEALVDREWKHVSLEDSGRRTKLIYDKQGRLYRVDDDPEAAQLLAPTL